MRKSFAYNLSLRLMLALMLFNGAAYAFALPGAWICSDGSVCSRMRMTGRDVDQSLKSSAPTASASVAKTLPACCKYEAISKVGLSSRMNCQFNPVPQTRIALSQATEETRIAHSSASSLAIDLAGLVERYQEKPELIVTPSESDLLPDSPDSRVFASRAPPLLPSIR